MLNRLLSFDSKSNQKLGNPLWFLLALTILILFPLVNVFAGNLSLLILPVSYTLLVITGMYTVANSKRVFRMGLLFGFGLILLVWINHATGNKQWLTIFQGLSFLVFFSALFIYLGRTVLMRTEIDHYVLYGVTIGYILIGAIGSTLFTLLDLIAPGSFLNAGALLIFPLAKHLLLMRS